MNIHATGCRVQTGGGSRGLGRAVAQAASVSTAPHVFAPDGTSEEYW